jgi:phosphate starvation-inducible PhoH-like protein
MTEGCALLEEKFEKRVYTESNAEAISLFGHYDQNLRRIEESFAVTIIPRGNELVITGRQAEVERVASLFDRLLGMVRNGMPVTIQEVNYAIRLTKEGEQQQLDELLDDHVIVTPRGKRIKAKTVGQRRYLEAISNNGLSFGIGPAGTGKTYLAMAKAVAALKDRRVTRIILTRPAVEAGEKLGFLPGDLQEKVDPYLRPLYDALFDIMGGETYEKFLQRGLIEVAPLAYMRGRTLDDSFVILDEAQNTTPEQMKMFLTRLGFGSQAVVTGDITQIDLPRGVSSGLEQARRILAGIEGIAFVYLTDKDVVRHPLVQKIILAYERFGREEGNGSEQMG